MNYEDAPPMKEPTVKKRLLIVEDDVELCRVLRSFLTARGYDILTAHRGGEALAICRTEPLDLLLLDIKLPDLDGYEVLRQLRSDSRTGHLPCLILTQKDERSEDYEAFAGLWDRYLTKPFEFPDLVRAVDEIVSLSRQESQTGMDRDLPCRTELLDTARQVTEQITLWQTAPDVAQALIVVDRRIASVIHDMSKLGALLDLIPPGTVAEGARTRVGWHLHRCRLAYEQLNSLRYKMRRYQPAEPTAVGNVRLPLPPLRWQQLLDGISRWQEEPAVALSTRRVGDEIHLVVAGQPTHEVVEIFGDLNRGKPQAIYGYLAHKIVTRYGGRLATVDDQLVIIFPDNPAPGDDAGRLAEKVGQLEAQRDTLARPVPQPPSAAIEAKTTRLIEPLALALLTTIDAALEFLDTGPDIDGRVQPWLSIWRNLRFFRLLTFDLCAKQPFHAQPVDLKTLLTDMTNLLAHRLIDHRLIVASAEPTPLLTTDEIHLRLLFIFLTRTILDYLPEDGAVHFQIQPQQAGYLVTIKADTVIERLELGKIQRYVDRIGCRLDVETGGETEVRLFF